MCRLWKGRAFPLPFPFFTFLPFLFPCLPSPFPSLLDVRGPSCRVVGVQGAFLCVHMPEELGVLRDGSMEVLS